MSELGDLVAEEYHQLEGVAGVLMRSTPFDAAGRILVVAGLALVVACGSDESRRSAGNSIDEEFRTFEGELEEKLPLTQGPEFGDEAIETLREGRLPSWPFDAADQETMRRFRDRLGPRLVELVKNGHAGAAYLAAFLRLHEAVPVLRAGLLSRCRFYGWEQSDPQPVADHQFPELRAYLHATELLTGKPAWEAVRLGKRERLTIQHRIDGAARDGDEEAFYCSVWLQQKLWPPGERPPAVDGALLAMHYRDYNGGFHDSGVLAMINAGAARRATAQEECWLLGPRSAVKPGTDNPFVPSVQVSIPWVHATDECADREPENGLPPRNLVGRFKLDTLQRSEEVNVNGDEKKPLLRRALDFLNTTTNGAFGADTLRLDLRHRRLAVSTGTYDVVEARSTARSACQGDNCWWQDWCGPGTTPHSAVVVYDAGDPDQTTPLFHEIAIPDEIADFQGSVALVDMIAFHPEGPPWLVLYNDLCEHWSFQLVRSGKDKDGWVKVLTGAEGGTI